MILVVDSPWCSRQCLEMADVFGASGSTLIKFLYWCCGWFLMTIFHTITLCYQSSVKTRKKKQKSPKISLKPTLGSQLPVTILNSLPCNAMDLAPAQQIFRKLSSCFSCRVSLKHLVTRCVQLLCFNRAIILQRDCILQLQLQR